MLTQALKEWAVAIEALAQGETIMLLRKGGIRETGGRFQVDHDRVWLYPTYEHQQPQLLKSRYANLVSPVASGWHPQRVQIQAYAEITDIFQVSDPAVVTALLPFQVWNEAFVRDRLRWKAREPLYVLLLRVWRLSESRQIAYRAEYGGCRSWIELEAIATEGASAVLGDRVYRERVEAVRAVLSRGMVEAE